MGEGKRRVPWWGALGVAVIAVGVVILQRDVEGWNTAWFLFAWMGTLLCFDAAIAFFGGGCSFLATRRRELLAMLFWSVPFWCLFEAFNLVLDNWHYVFLPRSEQAQALFAFAAFATVMPACFFPAELLRTLGVFERRRWPALRVGVGVQLFMVSSGLASIVLPLLWPRPFFWLIWFAALGLPAVINYRCGAPSLLRDLEQGRPARLLRLLLGGLCAGGLWEAFNFPARAKWVYTVPFFEDTKLFEMPLLGFVGFPLLALEAFAFYTMLCHFLRGGRSHEREDAEQAGVGAAVLPGSAPHGAAVLPGSAGQYLAMALIVAFSIATHFVTLGPAVLALRPLLSEIRGVDAASAGRLRRQGIPTPERLCRAIGREGIESVAARSQIALPKLQLAQRHTRLALHKGMGSPAAAALLDAGIDQLSQLAEQSPEALHARLRQLMAGPPPRPAQLKAWIRAARWSWVSGVPTAAGTDCR